MPSRRGRPRAAAAPYGAPVKLADVLDHLDVRFAAGLNERLGARYLAAIPVLTATVVKPECAPHGHRLLEVTDRVLGAMEG